MGRGPPLKRNEPEQNLDMSMSVVCAWSLPWSVSLSFPLLLYQFLLRSNLGPHLMSATTLLGCTLHTLDHPVSNNDTQLMLLPTNCDQDLICIGFQVGEPPSLKNGKRPKVRHKGLKITLNQWKNIPFSP